MISEKQRKILAFPYSKYRALICDGAIRSGKTSIMMWAFVKWAMDNFHDRRFGICGKTVGSAAKNIVEPFVSMTLANELYKIAWRRSEKVLEVTRGGVTNIFEVFGGKDESSFMLIQGRTLAGLFLDEVPLMPESFVNQALARCSVEGRRFWFSCNPENPNHWFYRGWIAPETRKAHNVLYLHFSLEDNPSLSGETREMYYSMYSGVFYDRYILGKWVAAEGLVYPMFDLEKNVVRGETERSGRYYVSVDYGTVNPTAMGLWRVFGGEAVMVKEYYYDSRANNEKRKWDDEYYEALENLAEGYTVERVILDPSAASFRECIKRHGKFSVRDAKNDVLPGIRLTGSLLKSGKIKFHESCASTFREFGLYSWDTASGTDRVIKENDHMMDSIRYFVMTVMRREIF